MPGQSPLRHGTGEGVGYHRRARRDVQSRRLPFLVGREPGRPGGVPADRHFAQYEGSARSTEVFGSDRLTHHVHILEMNGDSYRLRHSRQSAASQVSDEPEDS